MEHRQRSWRDKYQYIGHSKATGKTSRGQGAEQKEVVTSKVHIRIEWSRKSPKEQKQIDRWMDEGKTR